MNFSCAFNANILLHLAHMMLAKEKKNLGGVLSLFVAFMSSFEIDLFAFGSKLVSHSINNTKNKLKK